jgi:hypothetical protein
MKSREFMTESSQYNTNITTIREEWPRVYNFIEKIVGSTALLKQSKCGMFNTISSQTVFIHVQPSAGLENTKLALEEEDINYDLKKDVMGNETLKGKAGTMKWEVTTDKQQRGNLKEMWTFNIATVPTFEDSASEPKDKVWTDLGYSQKESEMNLNTKVRWAMRHFNTEMYIEEILDDLLPFARRKGIDPDTMSVKQIVDFIKGGDFARQGYL